MFMEKYGYLHRITEEGKIPWIFLWRYAYSAVMRKGFYYD
jgi:hypothetical protein